jgi:hypothetical protein
MATRCFVEKDSDPPVCGVHHVRLEKKQSPDDLSVLGYKAFTFFVCPVTGKVLNDAFKG